MTFLGALTPAADLLEVFNSYDGSVVFRGLTEGYGGQASALGRIGWIFTALGALITLWGFVLRMQRSGPDARLGEVAKTWVVIGFILGGPLLMRGTMEAADGLYDSAPGGPKNLTAACIKAAYAMPELNRLFDVLMAGGPPPAAAGAASRQSLVNSANDGSVMGYVEAFGSAVWDTAAGYADGAARSWNSLVQVASVAAGMGSAMLKCILIAATIAPLYLLFLAAGAIVWFMDQLRYFLAVSGAMMLPMFVGMYSLPDGHPGRQTAHAYAMHMISLALWPVAWAVGHTGTISLYNALISLIAGTSRVPDLAVLMEWSNLTTAAPSEAQLGAAEAALGNWFMGNLTGLLSILVGGAGFVVWVAAVSIMGPVFLHRLLTTGAGFMGQAAAATARQSLALGRIGLGVMHTAAVGGPGYAGGAGPLSGERLSGGRAGDASPPLIPMGDSPGSSPSGSSMADAARGYEDSGGKERQGM